MVDRTTADLAHALDIQIPDDVKDKALFLEITRRTNKDQYIRGHLWLDSDPPAGVNYDLWLGPAPRRPFNANRFHGNWQWYRDYGNGDIGNDGIHDIDMG